MNITIKNEEIAKTIEALAQEQDKSAEEVAEELLGYAVGDGLAVLLMKRIEYALIDEIIPKIDAAVVNSFAMRHQVLNMHADILQSPERAEAISKQASEIGHELVFGKDESEEVENV